MNEEEAIERCKELLKIEHSDWIGISNQVAISIVLNLVGKQNKVIDYILNDYIAINEIRTIMGLPHSITTAEELKKVYFRKVEEDDKN